MLQKITSDLIRFKTEKGNTEQFKKAYAYIESFLGSDMFQFEYIEHNDIISQIIFFKGQDWKQSNIILDGHMDVVPAEDSQYEPYVKENKLYGRGAVDMKSGIAAMLLAMKQIAEEGQYPPVAIMISGDEEIGGDDGAGYICAQYEFNPEFVVVADGPKLETMEITNREKGLVWLEVTAEGVAAHGSRPWLGNNAIERLIEAINKIKETLSITNQPGWHTTLSITGISTPNKTHNKIPDQASAILDIRFTETHGTTPAAFVDMLRKTLPAGIVINPVMTSPLVYTPENHPHMQRLQTIMQRVTQGNIPISYSDASHDAGFFAGKGIPTALIGPVGGNWHGKDEWVDVTTANQLVDVLVQYIKESV